MDGATHRSRIRIPDQMVTDSPTEIHRVIEEFMRSFLLHIRDKRALIRNLMRVLQEELWVCKNKTNCNKGQNAN